MTKTQVEKDYNSFFLLYPDQKNPSDLNTKEKFAYAMMVGFERHRAMDAARKTGRYEFTKRPRERKESLIVLLTDYLYRKGIKITSVEGTSFVREGHIIDGMEKWLYEIDSSFFPRPTKLQNTFGTWVHYLEKGVAKKLATAPGNEALLIQVKERLRNAK